MLNLNIRRYKWILFRDTKSDDKIIFRFRILEFGPEKSWIIIAWDKGLTDYSTLTVKPGDTRSFFIRLHPTLTDGFDIKLKYMHALPRGARAKIGINAPKDIRITQEDRENRAK